MQHKILTFVIFFGAFTAKAASLSPNNFPAELVFMGKPIDAYCFSDLNNPIKTIQLKNCGAIHDNLTVKKEKNDFLVKKNFVGYNWVDEKNHGNGFTYYQSFPAERRKFWIHTLNNGGGSGIFTSIYLFARLDNETVELKNVITGGDRCNGGIDKVELQNSKLHYSINLTAADVLGLIKENPKVKAYDNIAACAICCFASAIYAVDATLKPVLQYVDFGTNDNASEMPEQGTYQKCFNRLFASYVKKGKNKLDRASLTQFSNDFDKQCVNELTQ